MSTSFGQFEAFIPYINDTIVEANDQDIIRAMQMSMREITVDTEMFSETYTLDLVEGQTDYIAESIYSAKNYRVISIVSNGATLSNAQYSMSTSGRIIRLTTAAEDSVVGGLVIRTVIKPDLTCVELEEDQMELWPEAIFALTKKNLHAQPRKPWSDPLEASYQADIYEGYVELISQGKITVGQSGSTSVNLGARI